MQNVYANSNNNNNNNHNHNHKKWYYADYLLRQLMENVAFENDFVCVRQWIRQMGRSSVAYRSIFVIRSLSYHC